MRRLLTALLIVTAIATPAWTASAQDDSALVQRRNEVREVERDSLAALYEINPTARIAVERAAGFAVFSTFGIKVFFAGGTSGKGVVVNNLTYRDTFMKMVQVQAGLGFGAKKDRLIFVFETQHALREFVDKGWEVGAQAGASARVADRGGLLSGAVSVSPGVYLYQLTETGLSAAVTLGGTKYFKDEELN
jgi:lipid-binding SYLF domain-containing protein